MTRKIIQISTIQGYLVGQEYNQEQYYDTVVALCDDGSLWHRELVGNEKWINLPGIPQQVIKEDTK